MLREKGFLNVEHFPIPSFLQFFFSRVSFKKQNERREKERKYCGNYGERERRVFAEVKQKQKIVRKICINNP
jgi:hypothetical protein